MKTCPKCNRTFPDEGQKFCTFDGGLLIAPQTFDPNSTIRATSIDLNASERPTSRDLPDPNATIVENYPATVALPRNTGPTGHPTTTNAPDTAEFPVQQPPAAAPPPPSPPPQPPVTAAPPPPPAPPPQPPLSVASPPPPAPIPPADYVSPLPPPSTSAPLPGAAVQQPTPSAPLPQPATAPKKKSKAPWIILGVVLFLLLGGGALAGVFFFVVKPVLDKKVAEERARENPQVVVTSTPTPAPSVEQPSPAPTDTFVPPPNTVQFTSSKDGLPGALADHYFDFSFYYPQSWSRSQKPSAANFVEVERRLPPNLTQENFVVGWYTSTGTFVGDLPSYPKRVEEFSKRLADQFPEYKKISEGPTKVNSMDGYEFKWEGLSKGTERGDVHLWGRVIFVPTGSEGNTTGATLSMFTTSLAPELSSVEDVGTKGETPVILDSFRFGKKN
jgi:hypothetical protein